MGRRRHRGKAPLSYALAPAAEPKLSNAGVPAALVPLLLMYSCMTGSEPSSMIVTRRSRLTIVRVLRRGEGALVGFS